MPKRNPDVLTEHEAELMRVELDHLDSLQGRTQALVTALSDHEARLTAAGVDVTLREDLSYDLGKLGDALTKAMKPLKAMMEEHDAEEARLFIRDNRTHSGNC